MTPDILFKNITAVTMNTDQPAESQVQEHVHVAITGRKITHMLPSVSNEAAALEKSAKRIINGTHKVLMPGLYNTHTHAGMCLFRGYANDRNLEDWLFNYIFPAEAKLTPDLLKTGTTLAIAEMLQSGTVAFSDMYCYMDKIAESAHEAGILANISNGIIAFESAAEGVYQFKNDKVYQQVKTAIENFGGKNENNDGRVKIDASIHGCYTSFPPAWYQVTDFAAKHNLGLHVHLSETKTEQETTRKNFNTTPTKIFNQHGVFNQSTTAAHGVYLDDEDIAILAEKNVTIAHNPISNLKLASGLSPVTKLIDAGVNVSLGTDGVSSNNSHDLFEELKMATVNGAKAQGRAHESGQIKVGYDADIIMLDFNTPRQTMCYDPILNLAYSTNGSDVELTMCRGKILYEKGEFTTIDIEKTLHEARSAKSIFLS